MQLLLPVTGSWSFLSYHWRAAVPSLKFDRSQIHFDPVISGSTWSTNATVLPWYANSSCCSNTVVSTQWSYCLFCFRCAWCHLCKTDILSLLDGWCSCCQRVSSRFTVCFCLGLRLIGPMSDPVGFHFWRLSCSVSIIEAYWVSYLIYWGCSARSWNSGLSAVVGKSQSISQILPVCIQGQFRFDPWCHEASHQ